MSNFTYTHPENKKSFTFTKEQIQALQNAYSKASSIANSVDSVRNLDGCWSTVVYTIFFHLAPEIEDLPGFYTYDEEEPFIEWFDSLEINLNQD